MESLDFALFGGPRLTRETEEISLSRLQAALLALLAAADAQGLNRRRAVELLWDDPPGPRTRHRLSELLYALAGRIGLQGPAIEGKGDRMRLRSGLIASDLARLRECLEEGRIRAATDLVRAGFLPHLRDAPTDRYEDWLLSVGLRHETDVRRKALTLLSEAEDRGKWSDAARAAGCLIDLEPEAEEHLRRLMWARALEGRFDLAEEAYRGYAARARQRNDGWKAEASTNELLERVQALRPDSPAGRKRAALLPKPDAPLLGRERESAWLSRAFRTIPEALPRILLLEGEAGIGKTRLVTERLPAAELLGMRVLKGSSSEFERVIPLNPILEALDEGLVARTIAAMDEPWRSVLLALMPAMHCGPGPLPEPPYVQPGSVPRRLFEAVRLLLEGLAAKQPLVLFLDDFQWADETSIAVLQYLRRRWDAGGLTIVLCVRPPSPTREDHVQRFLSELRSDGMLEELELVGLAPGPASELVRRVATRPLTAPDIDQICSLGGRNPFFLIELTIEYVAGRIGPREPLSDVLPIPLSIRQVLERRLSDLGPRAKSVLDLLATYGHELRPPEIEQLAGLEGEACVLALEQLEEYRLVDWPDAAVRVRHELIRQTVYGALSDARRRWLHRRIAGHLEEGPEPRPVDGLALHYDRAGERELALRYSLEAAEKAESSGAVAQALVFLTIARSSTEDLTQTAELVSRLGHLHYLNGNFEEAASLLKASAARFRNQRRMNEAIRAEIEKVDALRQSEALPLNDIKAQLKRIQADAQAINDWEGVARALDVELHLFDRIGSISEARQTLRNLETCLEEGNAEAQCQAHGSLALHIFYGTAEKALHHARQSALIAAELDKHQRLHALLRLIMVLMHLARFSSNEGRRAHEEAETLARSSGDLLRRFRLQANIGAWLLDIGELDGALIELNKAERIIRRSGVQELHMILHYNLGELFFFTGEVDKAKHHFTQSEQSWSGAAASYARWVIDASLGLCALYEGDISTAVAKESQLPANPNTWYFDPSMMTIFQARMAATRGRYEEACNLLSDVAASLEGRLRIVWIKLKMEEARIAKRYKPDRALRVGEEVEIVARRFGLTARTDQIQRLLSRQH